MTLIEQLSELFSELGPQTPEIDAISQDEATPTWAVALVDGAPIEAALDEDRGVLALSTTLGRPAEEHRVAVYEALLMFNSLRAQTGGVVMSLAEPAGDAELGYDLAVAELTPAVLQTVLLNFAAKAQAWRRVVASGAAPGESAVEYDPSNMAAALRV